MSVSSVMEQESVMARLIPVNNKIDLNIWVFGNGFTTFMQGKTITHVTNIHQASNFLNISTYTYYF